ncbi:MAG TPA: nuclear transport factor 2 family protein [Pyrinomonadaceae bacterium]|nr:nuclear transport factor 2 family protein [Pyrinomonadaceae bacterium]
MLKVFALILLTCGVVAAQNSNSSTTTERQRKTNTNRAETPAPTPAPAPKKTPASTAQEPGSEGVLAAFNTLLDGIRHASVDEVMSAYWNNPRLNLFNYNGSVTKGWEQVKKNRESSYPEIKDVKLEVRDVSVTMLGTTGAVVTCQWKQSQTYKGAPETVSGRMTLAFKRIGNAWKAIHLHSSTDTPNPAVIPPSEQPVASPTPE